MATTRFILKLDGDVQGESPRIFVSDSTEGSIYIMEFFFEPIPLVEEPDSFEDGHWDFPELVKQTVQLMNEYA